MSLDLGLTSGGGRGPHQENPGTQQRSHALFCDSILGPQALNFQIYCLCEFSLGNLQWMPPHGCKLAHHLCLGDLVCVYGIVTQVWRQAMFVCCGLFCLSSPGGSQGTVTVIVFSTSQLRLSVVPLSVVITANKLVGHGTTLKVLLNVLDCGSIAKV